MLFLNHRLNQLEKLENTPVLWGAEIDLRDYDGELRLAHDPWQTGPRFADFLAAYHGGCLALNVKCDGLEEAILQELGRAERRDFFFVDLPGPALVRMAKQGVSQVAVRVSEYEPVEAALVWAGTFEWAWLDVFSRQPPSPRVVAELKKRFRVALVSPELHGASERELTAFIDAIPWGSIDAVCSDRCDLWEAAAVARGLVTPEGFLGAGSPDAAGAGTSPCPEPALSQRVAEKRHFQQ